MTTEQLQLVERRGEAILGQRIEAQQFIARVRIVLTLGQLRTEVLVKQHTRQVEHGVAMLAECAGLTKRVSPHTFRHSHCTEIQLRGASIAVARELMDHSSIATTSRYSHATDRSLRVALASLDDPMTWIEG